jgi:muramoyltetrapeptide carboxypeptidase
MQLLRPPPLKQGDRVRIVSPASPPPREIVEGSAGLLAQWGLKVEFGDHVHDRYGYLAGTDEARLADLNAAIRDPGVRAIFASRGGAGSYRIAQGLDFDALRNDPKHIIGFSDITALHLIALKRIGLAGFHGALGGGRHEAEVNGRVRSALMDDKELSLWSDPENPTSALSNGGIAEGRLVGGNLDMIATCAGWALPDLTGAVVCMEAVRVGIGHLDRLLTMLRQGGHLAGIRGVAVGQFTEIDAKKGVTAVDILRDHLGRLNVPVLGGLPFGHGGRNLCFRLGTPVRLDGTAGTLNETS